MLGTVQGTVVKSLGTVGTVRWVLKPRSLTHQSLLSLEFLQRSLARSLAQSLDRDHNGEELLLHPIVGLYSHAGQGRRNTPLCLGRLLWDMRFSTDLADAFASFTSRKHVRSLVWHRAVRPHHALDNFYSDGTVKIPSDVTDVTPKA